MSNARELGLLEKWTSSSSHGATIIPPLSSPTSPKATKFCCCPNRRRYNLKQPKLTTTLHVRNIFVDNDFNFIDDTAATENDDDGNENEADDGDEEILTLDTKNYKRAESWPSAKRTQKHNKSTKLIEVEVHKENRKNQVAATNDYDDIIEIAKNSSSNNNNNDNSNRNSSEKRVKVAAEVVEKTTEKEWRHDKSCHNNRNNCLTKNEQHERKSNSNSNNSRCSIESSSAHNTTDGTEQYQQHHAEDWKQSCVRKPLKQQSGNEVGETTAATAASFNVSASLQASECRKKRCENLQNTLINISAKSTANEQTTATTSPLIQRLSELSEFKHSLCKETFSNTKTTIPATPQQQEQHCNNCQFCFNQSCRNFSQLQQSLQDSSSNNNRSQHSSSFGDNQKMTITTATNVANNFKCSIASATASNNTNSSNGGIIANDCGLSVTANMSSTITTAMAAAAVTPPTPTTRTIPPPSTLLLATNNNSNNNTTPTSPMPRSNNTPSSPLTTTVIKTTMVKRSPANESATATTPTTATSPTSSATSASLTLEKSLAFITASNNGQDLVLGAKENKPANNKCLMDATTASSALPSSSSTPLSVKERIAALVAGNEQTQKQHDNFINRNSIKNQCNKPLRATAATTTSQQQQQQNMTCPQRQQPEASIVINGNNMSNMCQKSSTTVNARKASSCDGRDEIDDNTSAVGTNPPASFKNEAEEEEEHIYDNINHKMLKAATPSLSLSSNGVELRSSKPGGSAATIPRCSLSNHLQYHNAVNKYGSKAAPETTATTAPAPAMTHDNQQHQSPSQLQQRSILSNTTWPTAASSSSNDTTGDNSHDLTATTTSSPSSSSLPLATTAAPLASNCRSKLAALDNLDLALNLSDLPLDVDDDDDPYFVLQEYLERVKHEINEVFELHKARQKLQQQQPQPQTFESDTNTAGTIENQIIDTLKAAVSNDELSRSTESDSGFDSATGGGWCGSGHATTALVNNTTAAATTTMTTNGGSNKLPSRAKVTTTSNVKENDNNANKKDNDTRVMEIATKNEQQQQQQPAATSANSKELKPPKGALIPAREQGKQEQDAALASLPYSSATSSSSSATTTTTASSSTLKRLRKQLQTKSPAEVATDDVNMWANKFLRDLDNLMASDKATTTSSSAATAARASISPGPTSPMLLSAAATAVIQSRYGKGAHERYNVGNGGTNTIIPAAYDHQASGTAAPLPSSSSSSTNGIVLRPEKHATIPLQSFNLDCGRLDNNSGGGGAGAGAAGSGGNVTKTNVAYLRTLSAPTPSPSHTIYQALLHNHDNNSSSSGQATCGIVHSSTRQLPQRNSLAGGIFSAAFDQHQHQNPNLTNFQSNEAATATNCCNTTTTDMSNGDIKSTMSTAAKQTPTTILKIEETSLAAKAAIQPSSSSTTTTEQATATDVESLHQKRLRQLNMEMDNLRNTSIDQSQQLSALMQQNHYCTGGAGGGPGTGNKHKTLMTSSSCAMPKKASSATAATSSMGSPSIMTCTVGSKQQQQQTQPSSSAATTATSYLLHGSDATKKGSTSTIWTSEESILRSVGAVDEDNNSTSSSACEEASGVLSSGKSGISLDSSGVENDNNESGIGTATPPKDMSYWKGMPHHHRHHHHHNQQDNESVSSLDALRKMKFQKGSSVTSSDDPDLLEVLSLCDETHDDDDDNDGDVDGDDADNHNKSTINEEEDMDDYDMVDEEDEGHDEFETIPFCDCDYTEDGDASSASAGSSGTRTNSSTNNGSLSDSTGGVVLRRKYAASPIMVPQKCRSQSLDTSSLPNTYPHQGHGHPHMHGGHTHAQLARKLQHLRDRHKDRNQLSLALRQEPFQSMLAPTHFHELPSPSSASLHSGHEILDTQELSTKSNSAPLLLKQEKRRDDFANQNVTLRYSRSQSDRYLADYLGGIMMMLMHRRRKRPELFVRF